MSVLGGVNRISPRQLLLDWRAEDRSVIPRTGQTTNSSRSSSGAIYDQSGIVAQVPSNAPRFGFYGSYFGMFIEGARTSLLTSPADFTNAAWIKAATGAGTVPVVTSSSGTGPDGTTAAQKAVFVAPASGDASSITQNVTTSAGVSYSGSLWVQAFSTADVGKQILFRHVAANAYVAITLTAAWQRATRVETSAATSVSFSFGLRPALGGSTGTVSVLVSTSQLELGPMSSMDVASGSRSADVLSWVLNLSPAQIYAAGGLTTYIKYIDLGAQLSQAGALLLGSAALTDPWAALPYFSSSTQATAAITNEAHVRANSGQITTGLTLGDVAEFRGIITPSAGNWTAQFGFARNLGSESLCSVSTSIAAPVAFSQALLTPLFTNSASGFGLLMAVRVALGLPSLAALQTLDLN
jgi:hypothetical protein